MSTPPKPSPPSSYKSTFSNLKNLGPIAPSRRRLQRNARAAPAPTPSSNASKPTVPQQAMSRPQPARPFGMVDAKPPPAEENPWNAAVKPWQRVGAGAGAGKDDGGKEKEMAAKGSGGVDVLEKGKGDGKSALPKSVAATAAAATKTTAQGPKPSPVPRLIQTDHRLLASDPFPTTPPAPGSYISSMSRAANPGTIGGSPGRPIPAVPMSREDAIKEIAWRRQGGNLSGYGYGRRINPGGGAYIRRRPGTLGVIRGPDEPDWIFEERKEAEIQEMMKEGWAGLLW